MMRVAEGFEPLQDEIAFGHHLGERVPIHWVLVRDEADAFEPQALLSTDLAADPVEVLTWFVRR
jgi:4-aminobutyrate aminotransferase-like enzyme